MLSDICGPATFIKIKDVFGWNFGLYSPAVRISLAPRRENFSSDDKGVTKTKVSIDIYFGSFGGT